MAKCKVCGFRLTDGTKKCPICGAIAGSTKAGNSAKDANLPKYLCPLCKAEVISKHRYCPACGIELSEAAKKAARAEDKVNVLKLAVDYLKKKTLAWGFLGIAIFCIAFTLTIFAFVSLSRWNQRKEARSNKEEFTHAERDTTKESVGEETVAALTYVEHDAKQASVTEAEPAANNAAGVSDGAKETPLEAFKYEVQGKRYILTGIKDTTLTDIVIPSVFSEIGWRAFAECKDLTNVTILDSVSIIADAAFLGCSDLTNITIPDSVTEIREYTFLSCKSLTKVIIPNSITKIGGGAFSFCSDLTDITIPNSVTKIGKGAFSYCESLSNVTIPNSVTEIGESAFYSCKSLSNVTIPNSVTEIGESVFSHCYSLTNVTIPNSVIKIRNDAFQYCSGLTNVTIPASVTKIGRHAFNGCLSLKNVSIENPNFEKSDIARVFGDSPSFTEIKIGNKVVYLH